MTTLVIRPSLWLGGLLERLRSDVSRVVVVLSLVLGFSVLVMMRVVALDHIPGVNGDEALDSVQVRDVIAGRPTVLRMPTGRLLSPIYGAWIMALESWQVPSFTTLRLPAVVAGFLSLPLLFLFVRAGFSGFFVGALAILCWANPVFLTYSRVAIEQTLILPAQVILFYCAFRRNWTGLLFSFIAVLLVHPINVFLIPFLCAILIPKFLENRQERRIAFGMALLFVLGFLFELAVLPKNYYRFLDLKDIVRSLTDISTWKEFLKYYLRLLSGLTAFEQYVAAPPRAWVWLWDIFCAVIFVGVQGLGIVRALKQQDRKVIFLVLGNIVLVAGYFVITGKDAVTPGVARYAMILLLPALIAFVSALELCLPKSWGWLRIGMVALFAWGWVLQTGIFYFEGIQNQNSSSFRAYLTGEREPKAAVFQFIQSDARNRGISDDSIVVIAEDWWTYWPMRYLASDVSKMKLIMLEKNPEVAPSIPNILKEGGYVVGFSKTGPLEKQLFPYVQAGVVEKFDFLGYGQKSILSVWRFRGKS